MCVGEALRGDSFPTWKSAVAIVVGVTLVVAGACLTSRPQHRPSESWTMAENR